MPWPCGSAWQQLTDPEAVPARRRGSGGDRFQGRAWRAHQRCAAGDDDVLEAMEEMNDVAPAHNPPYIKAMRLLAEKLPDIPLVAAFETGFHATIPDRLQYYPAPDRVGRPVPRQTLGVPRCQPSLHRHADGRVAGTR